MKRKARLLSILFCVCLLICSCTGEKPPEDGETTAGPDPSTPLMTIITGGVGEYLLILPQDADMELQTAVSAFKSTVREHTGVSLRLLTDATPPRADEKEILIGATNRAASAAHSAGLKSNDYSIAREGDTLVIAGGSTPALSTALDRLISSCFADAAVAEFLIYAKDLTDYRANYPISSLTVNGKAIEAFRVVYPEGSFYLKQAAEELVRDLAGKTGVLLSTVSDATAKENGVPEILIGATNRASAPLPPADSAAYRWDDATGLQIIGDSVYATMLGVKTFVSDLSGTGTVGLTFPAETVRTLSTQEPYKVMSFNILYKDADLRLSVVRSMLLDELPDSFGLQECTDRWLKLLLPALEEQYACFAGEISTDGQFYLPVFYRKDRFELVDGRTLWLSDTPDRHSKLYDSDQYRTVTYAVLRDRETGAIYTHYNTHLDIVRTAAESQLKILQQITSESRYPYVVTGDFNIDMTWPQYRTMKKTWSDAREVAEDSTDDLTEIRSRIDYCMIGAGIIARRFSVVNSPYVLLQQWETGETNGQECYLSDHYPVYVQFSLSDPNS